MYLSMAPNIWIYDKMIGSLNVNGCKINFAFE